MNYILIALIVLVAVVMVRTIMFKPKTQQVQAISLPPVDDKRVAESLSQAVKFATVSNVDSQQVDWKQFEDFVNFIEQRYPLVHKHLEWERINQYSLLYRWAGKTTQKPILFLAHIDVVPVEEDTPWTHPAFSGAIADGFIWGRGTLDVKCQIIALLEATESMLAQGHLPNQDIYFAFGHDEEIRGNQGASKIAQILQDRGIEFEYVLDEGGAVVEDGLKGVDKPLAVVGTCEKGFANIRLTAVHGGGHASMPPKSTALGKVCNAVASLEKNQPRPRISSPLEEMLDIVGPYMPLGQKLIVANMWLFRPLFVKVFGSSITGNALTRTTTAATMAKGSKAANVLPSEASVTLNFRLVPGDTIKGLLAHIKEVVGSGISVELIHGEDPSKISSSDTQGFSTIKQAINELYPDALVTPYLMVGGTDARRYELVSKNIYRFGPFRVSNEEMKRVHATDERISIANMTRCVQFYMRLFK